MANPPSPSAGWEPQTGRKSLGRNCSPGLRFGRVGENPSSHAAGDPRPKSGCEFRRAKLVAAGEYPSRSSGQSPLSQPAREGSTRLHYRVRILGMLVSSNTGENVEADSRWLHSAGNRIADRPIPAAAPLVHPGEHRDLQVSVVVYDYFPLEVMQTVKAASILGKGSTP